MSQVISQSVLQPKKNARKMNSGEKHFTKYLQYISLYSLYIYPVSDFLISVHLINACFKTVMKTKQKQIL